MVKHVILWQLKDELSDTEKAAVKAGIKEGLEGLAGQIPVWWTSASTSTRSPLPTPT